mmetsp:Transcript_24348/g.39794  ORF Transcript_24348/g.39794 Transcript_24348/m.39794 type:complete len:217 (+) Transcript_24348:1452-2102(+)
MKCFQKATFCHQVGSNVVELGNTDGRCLAHVRIFVSQGTAQRFAQVLRDTIDTDASHGSHRQCPNERVGIVGVLHKRVDGQQGQFGLRLGVVDQVQVHQLFEFNVSSLNAIENIRKEHGDVFSYGHVGDDLFDGIDLDMLFRGMELHSELMHFTLFLGGEEPRIIRVASFLAFGHGCVLLLLLLLNIYGEMTRAMLWRSFPGPQLKCSNQSLALEE